MAGLDYGFMVAPATYRVTLWCHGEARVRELTPKQMGAFFKRVLTVFGEDPGG